MIPPRSVGRLGQPAASAAGLLQTVFDNGARRSAETAHRALDGLPSDQISAVTVVPRTGRVWIGTACDGVACSDPPYESWTTIRAAAERSGDGGEAPPQTDLWAAGLPSNLINGLAVLQDGSVAVATDYGLGLLNSPGPDENERIVSPKQGPIAALLTRAGLRPPPPRGNWGWQGLAEPNPRVHQGLPHCDAYLNAIEDVAQDAAGRLWLATRYRGLACLNLQTGALVTFRKGGSARRPASAPAVAKPAGPGLAPRMERLLSDAMPDLTLTEPETPKRAPPPKPRPIAPAGPPDDYIFALATAPDGAIWCGSYGGALARLGGPLSAPAAAPPPVDRTPVGLPAPMRPPTLAEMNGWLADLADVPAFPAPDRPLAVRLGDDWRTRGDWAGRYCRHGGIQCSVYRPYDRSVGEFVTYNRYMGGNHRPGDSLRHWIHWMYTDNPNTLEIPPSLFGGEIIQEGAPRDKPRRQSEWDDHGETYSMALDGPHCLCDFRVPEGEFLLSLYFFNKDGHSGSNRWRDFRIFLKEQPDKPFYGRRQATSEEQRIFDNRPVLAEARVRDFWNGVYVQFLITGRHWYTLEVQRNHSFNTIISALYLDRFQEEAYPDKHRFHAKWEAELKEWDALDRHARSSPDFRALFPGQFEPADRPEDAARRLLALLNGPVLRRNPLWFATRGRGMCAKLGRYYEEAIRATGSEPLPELQAALATCCFHLHLFESWETAYALSGREPQRVHEQGKLEARFAEHRMLMASYAESVAREKAKAAKETADGTRDDG